MIGCNNIQKPVKKGPSLPKHTTPDSAVNGVKENIQYSDKQLEIFLDSVGHLPTQPLADETAFWADSIFKSQLQIDTLISLKDFNQLKHAAHTGVIDVKTARRIFRNDSISYDCNEKDVMSTYKVGKIPLVFYSFGKDKNSFNEFALCVGDPENCENAYLYFFKGNRIIARHDGYSHYGLNLEHFTNIDGETVVYYITEFDDGSGVWWNNFFFYKYDGNKLIPVLNELQNGNSQAPSPFGSRTLWLESFVQKTNPLTIKMVYYQDFPDSSQTGEGVNIINDSTTVKYVWDEQSKTLKGQYLDSKISKPQILSYYLGDNDLLYINAYNKLLKSSLLDKTKRQFTLNYLNGVKNYYRKN